MPAAIASWPALVRRSRSAGLIASGNFVNGLKNGLSSGFETSCLSSCAGTRLSTILGQMTFSFAPSFINAMFWSIKVGKARSRAIQSS